MLELLKCIQFSRVAQWFCGLVPSAAFLQVFQFPLVDQKHATQWICAIM